MFVTVINNGLCNLLSTVPYSAADRITN